MLTDLPSHLDLPTTYTSSLGGSQAQIRSNGTTTLTGGYLSITNIFWPMTRSTAPGEAFKGFLNSGLTAVMMACAVIVLLEAVPRWARHWRDGQ